MRVKHFILLSLLLICSICWGQNSNKPFRTGLVLSGGGAKGIAHVGLLQAIDSLEIQIDYITGTSMGSIVGGLYAIGYSADSIEHIIQTTNWEYILSNSIPLSKVHINEKENYQKSNIQLPFRKGLPQLPTHVIESQYLSAVLGKFFFDARNINDFHKLPIPLEVIATDIVSGEEVILQSGYLSEAIRASMAIPAFFSPVHIDGKILVDGGLKKNFPVEEVINMGADFVIGSYTGFRQMQEEDMTNLISSIYQSFALEAVQRSNKQKSLTNILLDFSEPLQSINTSSFSHYKDILKIGRMEAKKLIPQLVELKKKQVAAGIQYKRKKIKKRTKNITKITINTPNNKKISTQEINTIKQQLNYTNLNQFDTLQYLYKGIEHLFASQFYDKIYYTFNNINQQEKQINLFLKKKRPTLDISLHYDTYQSAGIVMKYTEFDFGLKQSKLSVALDLSTRFKNNIQYIKYFGKGNKYWTKFNYQYRHEKNNDLFFRLISQVGHFTEPSLYSHLHQSTLSIGYTPALSTAISFGWNYGYNRFNKHSGYLSSFWGRSKSKQKPLYRHSDMSLFFKVVHNTLNHNILSTKGNKTTLLLTLFFNNKLQLNKPSKEDKIGWDYYKILNPDNYEERYSDNVLQLKINEQFNIAITKKITLQTQLFAGFNCSFEQGNLRLKQPKDYLFLNQKIILGGYYNYDQQQTPISGFGINELNLNNVLSGSLRLQYNPWKKIYLTPSVSIGTERNYDKNNSDSTAITYIGMGLDIDYLTLLGPIKLGVYANNITLNPFLFFSIGYQF